MGENRHRHTVWMDDAVWDQVESHYQKDNCSTKNEYIEKAIQFYSGYLNSERAGDYLPRVLADVLEGKLGALGKRMGHLLFKLAVELAITMNLIAAAQDIDRVTLERLRGECVKEVKRINGAFSFDDAVDWQKG